MIRSYLRDKTVFLLWVTALCAHIFLWVLVFWKIRPSEVPFTLHYNVYRGVDLIGEYKDLYKIPLFGLFFLICNILLGIYFYQREKMLAYIFFAFSLFVQVAFGIAFIALIRLNY